MKKIWAAIVAIGVILGIVSSVITIDDRINKTSTSGSDLKVYTPIPTAVYTPSPKPLTPSPAPVITNSPVPQISVKPGSIKTFGKYKGEEINWYVVDIDRSADTALLVSVKAVDVVQYHSSTKTTAWADCDLRDWLNNTFYQDAFSQEEKDYILTSIVEGCSDKVYILSQQEVRWYLSSMGGTWRLAGSKVCYTSRTETGRQIYVNSESGYSSWWLRTPTTGEKADLVGGLGEDPIKNPTNNGPTSLDNGVRPVVLVSLNLFR